jgi:two-component system, NarL family, nitrate/nitrite response regulator NarL
MIDQREAAPLRLGDLVVGIWGRHELYVMSLAALMSERGAAVRVFEDPADVLASVSGGRVRVLLLESPLPSELRMIADGETPVIVLSENARPEDVAEALAHGAHALLAKNASLSDLLRTIRIALAEGRPEPIAALTERQRQVLRLVAEGLDNAQIAERMGISQRTARAHVSSVLERLGVENRTQAAVAAIRSGWIA